jgi:transcriptional regulator with XRE-family HTH domain
MKIKIRTYNVGHDVDREVFVMPKRKALLPESGERFGERMARLRKTAGYSQRDLASETGIPQRVIAYYESESEYPPTHLLPVLGKALGVTADQLLGMDKAPDNGKARDNRLWRRFSQVEKLPPARRKPIIQLLDAFLKSEKA